MKKGWEIRRLPEIAEYSIGLTYSPKDVSDKGTVVLRSSNIQNDQLDLSDLVRVASAVKHTLKVREGDILMCSRNGSKRLVGKTALIGNLPEEMTFGTFMTVIRGKFNPYLAWFFKSDAFREQIGVGGNTMINQITKYMLDAIRVPFPPPAEQQRIVGLLDEWFTGLTTVQANAERNLQNARALFESHLQSVFTLRGKGWVETTIGEICDITHGFAFDGADFSHDVPEGNPLVITPGNFTEDGRLRFNDRNTKRFRGEAPAGFQFTVGDLIVVMTDLSSKMKILGKPAFVETDDVLHNQRIGRVVFSSDRVERRLLYFFMMSEGFLKDIKMSATGTMVKHTAPKRIMSNVIPFPEDRREQRAIIAKLDDLRGETQRLAHLYDRKLAALEGLKKSLLHEAFTGQLIPKHSSLAYSASELTTMGVGKRN